MNLGALVTRNAGMLPDKEALIFEQERYTWYQVNDLVNRFANTLIDAGFTKGDTALLWMENSDLFVIAFYAVVKAGGVAVPVNYRLAKPEAEYIFTHSDAVALVFDDGFEPIVRELEPNLVSITQYYSSGPGRFARYDPLQSMLREGSPEEPAVSVDEDDLSEILYTAAFDGTPRGAVFTHHSQMVLAASALSVLGLCTDDIILHMAPLFHGAQLNLYLNPGTYVGATHVIRRNMPPYKDVLLLMEKERITQVFGPPVMYSMLMNEEEFEAYDLSSIRRFAYGAAPMSAEKVREMLKKFGRTDFVCLCGLIEGGPGGVALPPDRQVQKAGSGGMYAVNMEWKLTDEGGETITRPGVAGELALRGETIMTGYYKDPDATKEIIRDGWLFTGDVGVMDSDGCVTLVGRKKDLIITGGENVYAREVEIAVGGHPGIKDVAVIGMPHSEWGETVMAVIVADGPEPPTLSRLREFLEQKIADYKIPRILEVMEELPRSETGEVSKDLLREMFRHRDFKTG
ncbi:MAG: AMP-binding protein [Deltaproteobacteria bacterium]|nr:AMP-binding protein [Candidatus Zymogenaceae bacterium]